MGCQRKSYLIGTNYSCLVSGNTLPCSLEFITSSLHSESTLEAGEAALLAFEKSLEEYSDISEEKQWNFIKAHSHKHVFTDILRKGVTLNFSTKPNEKAHSPLKDFYQLMTNFKDFGVQILKLNEKDVVSTLIHEQIDLLDQVEAEQKNLENEGNTTQGSQLTGTEHVSLFSAINPCTIEFLESEFSRDDRAFTDFRKRLSKSLSSMFSIRVNLSAYDEISPYRSLHVNYESVVSWGNMTDILRAHPLFHNRPQYDCALINAGDNKYFFAQLLYLFGVFVQGETQYMALVLPYDAHIPHVERPQLDRDLKFTQVQARPRSQAAFIHVESIVRGAVLIPAHDNPYGDKFLVFDQVDEDLWTRMQSMKLAVSVPLS